MTTYENYYGITKDGDVDKYNAFIDLRLNDMLGYLAGIDDAEILKDTFYLSLGPKPMDEWTVYRITGDTLTDMAGNR